MDIGMTRSNLNNKISRPSLSDERPRTRETERERRPNRENKSPYLTRGGIDRRSPMEKPWKNTLSSYGTREGDEG